MTLCLAQSLIDHAGAFVARDQVRKYIDWYRGGYFSATGTCFDIGGATRLALETWEAFYETELGSREGGRAPDEVQREGQALVDAALKKKVLFVFFRCFGYSTHGSGGPTREEIKGEHDGKTV